MKVVCSVLVLAVSAAPGFAAGDPTKCILKAKENIPSVAGIQIKSSRTRPMPADQLANWKGQSKPIIVDIETVANGHEKCTHTFVRAAVPASHSSNVLGIHSSSAGLLYSYQRTSPLWRGTSDKCQKQTSPSRIHRYSSCVECVPASHRRRPSPRYFQKRERLERRGPAPLCGPVLFRQPGRRCMLNGRTSSSPRAVPGACRSPRFVLAASMPSASVTLQ